MAKVERALIAYSVLKDQLEKGDLYDGLMIFLRPLIAPFRGKNFVPADISLELSEKYNLRVSPLVIESLSERMANAGLLIKYSSQSETVLYKYADIEVMQSSVSLPSITELLSHFTQFAKQQSADFEALSNEEIEEILLDRLLNIDSLKIFSRKDGVLSQKQSARTISAAKNNTDHSTNSTKDTHFDFIVSKYLLELEQNDSSKFTLLTNVVEANLAAETLLSFREPPKKGESFDELDIYLDTPLCLDILGVNIGRQEYGQHLYNELKNANCVLNVFLHTIEEIERVLDARRQSYISPYNQIGRNQHEPIETQSLVKAIAGHAEQFLTETYGINIIDSASIIPQSRRNSVGPEEERSIRESLVGWKNDEGRETDVKTCSDLIRIRGNLQIQTRLLKSGAILVTRNTVVNATVNRVWRDWLNDKKPASESVIKNAAPIAILDKRLIGILWITQGGKSGSLSRTHLIANCSAAISTKKDVITKTYNTLLNINESEAKIFEALINDQRAERALMNHTYGDPDVVTDESVIAILENVKQATANEILLAKNAEIDALNKTHEDAAKAYESIFNQKENHYISGLAQRDEEINNLKEQLKKSDLIAEKKLKRYFAWCNKIYNLITFVVVFTVLIIAFFVQSWILSLLSHQLSPNATTILNIIFALAVIGPSFLFSWDIPEILLGSFRISVCEKTLDFLLKISSLEHLKEKYTFDFKNNTWEAISAQP